MMKFISKLFINLVRYRIKSVVGITNIPKQGPAIFVSNHVGQQDPVLVYALLMGTTNKKIHSIAKWKIISKPWWQKNFGTIPLYEERQKSIDCSISIVKNKGFLLLFPEGGVNLANEITKVKTGAARIALQTKSPIIPIGLERVNKNPKNEFNHFMDIFFGTLKISVGSPIYLDSWYNKDINKQVLNEVNCFIMTKVGLLANKKYNPGNV